MRFECQIQRLVVQLLKFLSIIKFNLNFSPTAQNSHKALFLVQIYSHLIYSHLLFSFIYYSHLF